MDLGQSDTNEPRTCSHCGIFYYEWLHGEGGFKAMVTAGAELPEPLIPNVHECPEPYPRHVAEMLLGIYSQPGSPPISQKMKARIKLGLEFGS
jgi:hypothetical protein